MQFSIKAPDHENLRLNIKFLNLAEDCENNYQEIVDGFHLFELNKTYRYFTSFQNFNNSVISFVNSQKLDRDLEFSFRKLRESVKVDLYRFSY